jgi:hypothetical protein
MLHAQDLVALPHRRPRGGLAGALKHGGIVLQKQAHQAPGEQSYPRPVGDGVQVHDQAVFHHVEAHIQPGYDGIGRGGRVLVHGVPRSNRQARFPVLEGGDGGVIL